MTQAIPTDVQTTKQSQSSTPSGEDMVSRANELLPTLKSRTAKADELRRLPDETIAEMKRLGFFRMLQPARWGGYELDPQYFFRSQWTIASACPSTAWVLGVVAVHSWQLALFPLEAQEEVWGKDTDVLISSSYAPTGKIEKVDGGYKVSGRWSFSSGSDHCDWVFLGGFVPTEGGPPDMRTFLLPKRDYVIDDNWHTMGLRGTGSKDIVVDGAFVPEHRTHKFSDGFKQKSPGNELNPAPLFKLPFGQIFVRSVSTSAIGIAQGALNAFLDIAQSRIAASDGSKVFLDPTTQVVASEAEATIDECRVVLLRAFDQMMAAVRAGEPIPIDLRVKYRYESGIVATKCMGIVDQLMSASGGRAIFQGAPIQRYFLDVHCARAHYANNPDKPARNYGGVQLGQNTTDFFI